MDNIFINHLKDLLNKAERSNRFTFTGFLSLDEQNELKCGIPGGYTLFGGAESCERVVARFGSVEENGYDEAFPIVCIKAEPANKKFADELTHRDFLGAVMNLGIERKNIGDIIVKEATAYMFVLAPMAEYISEGLTRVKRTVIKCSLAAALPDGELFSVNEETVIVASMRLDCIVAGAFKLSRNQANGLFAAQRVFVNGRLCENTSHILKDGDIVSLRGYGRFKLLSCPNTTKKGRICAHIGRYV